MAQHHDVGAAGLIVVGGERASVGRLDAEQRKEIVRHAAADDALGLIALGEVEADAGGGGKMRRRRQPLIESS